MQLALSNIRQAVINRQKNKFRKITFWENSFDSIGRPMFISSRTIYGLSILISFGYHMTDDLHLAKSVCDVRYLTAWWHHHWCAIVYTGG